MSIDRIVLAFAGCMILASLVLAYYFGPYWLLLTAFVGLNLFQAAFTGICEPKTSRNCSTRPTMTAKDVSAWSSSVTGG